MNLFRSEEHARNWSGYTPEAEEGLLSGGQIMEIFSAEQFRARGAPDYISRYPGLRPKFLRTLEQVTGGRPFWQLPK